MNTPSLEQLQAWDAFKQMNHPVLSTVLLEEIMQALQINYQFISHQQIAVSYKKHLPFSHKGTHGHALIIAGNYGKMGAAILCAKACLRSGAGLVTAAVPENLSSIIQTALPEAMVVNSTQLLQIFDWNKYSALGVGPGWGIDTTHAQILLQIIKTCHHPMVIDADAITILSENKQWLNYLSTNTIVTPHVKEFDRLFGNSLNDFERWNKALEASLTYQCIIVVKGTFTLIASKGKAFINSTGNAGLAKGGSGDVLTGIITALIAQHYSPEQAAITGVYLHGLAANIALEQQTTESMLATDVIEALGKIKL